MSRTGRVVAWLAIVAAGCGDGPSPLDWRLRFADPGLGDSAATLHAWISRGDCEAEPPADALFEIDLEVGQPIPRGAGSPPALGSGGYAFWVRALDGSCAVIGGGCTSVVLPQSADFVEVSIEATTPTAGCARCEDGRCVDEVECPSGYADCNDDERDGCETSLSSSATCGACDVACGGATPLCEPEGRGFRCVGTCADEAPTLCDGLCVDTLTSTDHCGDCGVECELPHATGLCSQGSCQPTITDCDSDWGDCDDLDATGCETPLETLSDCGGCGRACPDLPHASEECHSDECRIDDCEPGWGDCDERDDNGCEAAVTAQDCCGRDCSNDFGCCDGECCDD